MNPDAHDYIPAAGHDRLLRFYDPITRLLGANRARERLLDTASIQPGEQVLDLGCGTGAVSLLLKQRQPAARVVGIDPDEKALTLARDKATGAGIEVEWRQAYARSVPFAAHSFDRVVSSLVIHHLSSDEKREAFREVLRVLHPGGTFHLLDFGPPRSTFERLLAAAFHRDARVGDNIRGVLPEWLREDGFQDVREVDSLRTLFGRVALYAARAPR